MREGLKPEGMLDVVVLRSLMHSNRHSSRQKPVKRKWEQNVGK